MAAAPEFSYGESLSEINPQYTPTTIRILTLLPRSSDSLANLSSAAPGIRTEVHLVDLNNLGSMSNFSALSYTWKPDNPKQTILVNDSPCSVGANLYSALCQLQSLPIRGPRNLWIDAICINQDDAREKSHQISMMGQIYTSAERVLSWLGPEADGSSLTFKRINLLGQVLLQLNRLENNSEISYLTSAVTVGFNPNTWLPGMDLLVRRDYWKRAWIRQEVVLSKELYVLCGSEITEFLVFLCGIRMVYAVVMELCEDDLNKSLDFHLLCAQQILTLGSCYEEFGIRHPCSSLSPTRMSPGLGVLSREVPLKIIINELCISSHFRCEDPRDQVLSLLGLFPKSARSVVQFDYQTTAEDLYTRLTEALIRACWNEPTNAFRVLSFSQRTVLPESHLPLQPNDPSSKGVGALEESSQLGQSSLGAALPSWVSDWSQEYSPNLCHFFDKGGFNASLNISLTDIHLSPADVFISTKILRVPIVHFDHIFEVGVLIDQTKHILEYGSAIKLFRRGITGGMYEFTGVNDTLKTACFDEGLPYGAPKTPSHDRAIAHTFVAGGFTNIKDVRCGNGKSSPRSGAAEEAVFKMLVSHTVEEKDAGLVDNYLEALYHVANGRRPALTMRGRIGMVPESAQPGDKLVVVIGAPSPFVVRPVHREGNDTQRHILIGECYIHGVMDGEIVKDGLEKMSFIELE